MKNRNEQVPVPGLKRGVAVLRLLEDGHPARLEDLAARSGLPRASLLRLLETLAAMGLVVRDPGSKRYRGLARVMPLSDGTASWRAVLAGVLARLAEATGQTAEWYEPSSEGLVLTERAESALGQVHVRARVGFLRTWTEELESVACIGWAFHQPADSALPAFWEWSAKGKQAKIPPKVAARRVAQARQSRFRMETNYNHNGVRRMAVAVLQKGKLRGVLALAQCFTPDADRQTARRREALTSEATFLEQAGGP
ncbi:MAG: hypothetical protein A3K19_26830 [Lentisphaerae bacterium RIFOXYB12_FULL_65_16]|nr:MAG: hypothetical protein A3K18_03330 [Lentisphaerae bacterium RIFOXYA12_64_32]OGV84334.1 MAG: hypothetical protein A3K19_26830 [Lentisphaerae bacterium RIFOXYB12_FULL_65_16]